MKVVKLTDDEVLRISYLKSVYEAREAAFRNLQEYKASLARKYFQLAASPRRYEFDETDTHIVSG